MEVVWSLSGILTAICECEAEEEVEYCEQVIKGRSLTGTNALVVLHNLLDQGGEPAMAYSARVLRLVAQDPMVSLPTHVSCLLYTRFLKGWL